MSAFITRMWKSGSSTVVRACPHISEEEREEAYKQIVELQQQVIEEIGVPPDHRPDAKKLLTTAELDMLRACITVSESASEEEQQVELDAKLDKLDATVLDVYAILCVIWYRSGYGGEEEAVARYNENRV